MHSIALIGCGDVAEQGHLPAILQDQRFKLTAACDLNRSRAELLSSRGGGLRAYTDWRDLLASEPQLDAVVLALPPEVSPDIAIESLSRGLAVLDEKPLATTLHDGQRLRQVVEKHRGVYQVGFVLRYGEWIEVIRRHVPRLGGPLQISVEIYDERLNPADTMHLERIAGFIRTSSAMTHEGSHVIDYVSLWNPSPWVSASAVARQTSPAIGGPNVWDSQIELADRSVLTVRIGWLLRELPASTVTIVGPEGRLSFNFRTGQGHVEIGAEETVFQTTPLAAQWKQQYAAFAGAISAGFASVATVDDGFRALETTLACEVSARTGTTVTAETLRSNGAAMQPPSNGSWPATSLSMKTL